MPKPRRRTLSHSEIENFLTEISQVSGENHVNKQAKQANDGGYVTKHQRHDVEDHAETYMEEDEHASRKALQFLCWKACLAFDFW